MKQLFTMFAVVLGIGVVAGEARAEVVAVPNAGVSIDVPAGWNVARSDLDVILSAADGTVTVTLAGENSPTPTGTWAKVASWVGTHFDDLVLNEAAKGELAGMPVVTASANGTLDAREVSIIAGMLTTPADLRMVFFVISDLPAGKAHQAELQQAMDSLTPNGEASSLPTMDAAVFAFAEKLRAAIDRNDARAFLAMIPAKWQRDGRMVKKATVKKALKKWTKKKGGIAGYLGLGRGDWQIEEIVPGSFMVSRGDRDGVTTYLLVTQVAGKWRAAGTGTFEPLQSI